MGRRLPFLHGNANVKRHDPTIATRRLILRPPTQADIDDIAAAINDPRVARMMSRVPFPYRRRDAEAFLAARSREAAAGAALSLSISPAGRVIGGVAIAALPYRCELSYWLGHPWWRRGFGSEAAPAVVAYGFEELDLDLVRSSVAVDDPASLRVLLKLGFRPIGTGNRRSLARGEEVAHIDTVLTRARYWRRGK